MKKFYTLSIVLLFCCVNLYAQHGVIKYWRINDNLEYKKECSLSFNRNQSFWVFDLKPYSYWTDKGYKVSSKGQYNAFFLDTKTGEATVYRRKGSKKKTVKAQVVANKKKWTIHQEFKTLLNYKVQKATLDYEYIPMAGENPDFGKVEVWFAVDIPVDAGLDVEGLDYVLHGLPGVILEVKYENSNWRCQAFDIQLSKEEIPLNIPENATQISKEEFWQ